MASVVQNRVAAEYTICLPPSGSDCGPQVKYFKTICGASDLYKLIDGRVLVPVPPTTDNSIFIPLRAWKFPDPVSVVTMYILFNDIKAIMGFAFPTMYWRILVGMGGTTDRVAEGTYLPPDNSSSSLAEQGMLFQYGGRLFDTIELHVRFEDPSEANAQKARQVSFMLAMYAYLTGHADSIVQTGLNGNVTYVATTFNDFKDLIP